MSSRFEFKPGVGLVVAGGATAPTFAQQAGTLQVDAGAWAEQYGGSFAFTGGSVLGPGSLPKLGGQCQQRAVPDLVSHFLQPRIIRKRNEGVEETGSFDVVSVR